MKFKEQVTHEHLDATYTNYVGMNGNLLDLEFEASFPISAIEKRKPNLWRYREALPVLHDEDIVSFDEGFTPLIEVRLSNKKALIKQEQLFATGSYKDRGATVMMSHVNHLKIKKVVQDSSGNAGCAVAAYAARAGIACDIYVPADTSAAKLVQMKWYGAQLFKIAGTREDTAAAALDAALKHYYASHCYNPFFLHGTKTFAYEVCEQLGWKAPNAVVLPAGNGTLLLGCYIGFHDLLKAGIIHQMPKLIAVQSANCAPLAKAFERKQTQPATVTSMHTLAEGIAIAAPVRGAQMLSVVNESKGHFITVTEAEIIDALREVLGQGFYIEPTSAATIAGLKKYLLHSENETVVSLFSGHGLKSTEKLLKLSQL
ncbi:MAG: threonine synthase [Bacteroidota bacterium]